MSCPVCGGTMIGDGYTSVMRCENALEVDYEGCYPDADPVHCRALITCEVCREPFDPGDLDAVCFHIDHKPKADIQYEGPSKKIA